MKSNELRAGCMYAEDYDRLLGKAFDEGVTIRPSSNSRIYLANSISQPSIVHRVHVAGCSCAGHQNHGRCKHRARLLFDLGPVALNRWCSWSMGGHLIDWKVRLTGLDTAA